MIIKKDGVRIVGEKVSYYEVIEEKHAVVFYLDGGHKVTFSDKEKEKFDKSVEAIDSAFDHVIM